jgi:hypothetical protein
MVNTSKSKKSNLIDPEPFSIIVSAVGIIGSIASVLAAFKTFFPEKAARVVKKIIQKIDQAEYIIRYLETDAIALREIIEAGDINVNKPFELGSSVFVYPHQHRLYSQTADNILKRLRELYKIANQLETMLPTLTEQQNLKRIENWSSTKNRINNLIRKDGKTIKEANDELLTIIQNVRRLVDDVKSEFR